MILGAMLEFSKSNHSFIHLFSHLKAIFSFLRVPHVGSHLAERSLPQRISIHRKRRGRDICLSTAVKEAKSKIPAFLMSLRNVHSSDLKVFPSSLRSSFLPFAIMG